MDDDYSNVRAHSRQPSGCWIGKHRAADAILFVCLPASLALSLVASVSLTLPACTHKYKASSLSCLSPALSILRSLTSMYIVCSRVCLFTFVCTPGIWANWKHTCDCNQINFESTRLLGIRQVIFRRNLNWAYCCTKVLDTWYFLYLNKQFWR